MSNQFKLKSLSEIIRDLRAQNGLLLRQVAAEIEIDQALLSKIERGDRLPTRNQVIRLAGFYKIDPNELLIALISDKLVHELRNEELAISAMQVAEKKINYNTENNNV